MMRQRKGETGAEERDFTLRGASGTALAWSGWLVGHTSDCPDSPLDIRMIAGGMADARVADMAGWLFVSLAADGLSGSATARLSVCLVVGLIVRLAVPTLQRRCRLLSEPFCGQSGCPMA